MIKNILLYETVHQLAIKQSASLTPLFPLLSRVCCVEMRIGLNEEFSIGKSQLRGKSHHHAVIFIYFLYLSLFNSTRFLIRLCDRAQRIVYLNTTPFTLHTILTNRSGRIFQLPWQPRLPVCLAQITYKLNYDKIQSHSAW